MQNYDFFNHLSSNYDEMISIEKSIPQKKKYLEKYLETDYKSALDLGCGTGADSIALSQLGLKVTAVDQSAEMLKIAEANAIKYNVQINFIKSDLSELKINGDKFDLIVSLGNTLANLTEEDLHILFSKFHEFLNSKGKIILQLINFIKLPASGNYLLNAHSSKSVEIIRQYDIQEEHIDFIITMNNKLEETSTRIVTKIYPHNSLLLDRLAGDFNLRVHFFGNLLMDDFDRDVSENLIAVVTK